MVAINPQKVQGPGLSVKFLAVALLGKTKVLPSVINRQGSGIPSPYCAKAAARIFGYTGILMFLFTPLSTRAEAFIPIHKERPNMGQGENGTGGLPA